MSRGVTMPGTGRGAHLDTVSTVRDAFNWFSHVMAKWRGVHPAVTPDRLAHGLATTTLSTAFSGSGTPEKSSEVMRAWLATLPGHADSTSMACKFAVESLAQSQRELAALPHPPSCIFNDMCGFIRPEIHDKLHEALNNELLDWPDLVRTMCTPNACSDYAFCTVHGKCCQASPADLHVAGTVCVDYSRTPGAKRGGTMGKACLSFLSWVNQRKRHLEKCIIHENVEAFLTWLWDKCLPKYHWQSVLLGPAELGWPVRRPRRITVLLLKSEARHATRRAVSDL